MIPPYSALSSHNSKIDPATPAPRSDSLLAWWVIWRQSPVAREHCDTSRWIEVPYQKGTLQLCEVWTMFQIVKVYILWYIIAKYSKYGCRKLGHSHPSPGLLCMCDTYSIQRIIWMFLVVVSVVSLGNPPMTAWIALVLGVPQAPIGHLRIPSAPSTALHLLELLLGSESPEWFLIPNISPTSTDLIQSIQELWFEEVLEPHEPLKMTICSPCPHYI